MTATPQNGQTLIDKFEQDTGDTTELSTTAELALLNSRYRLVLSDRDWEFLKKNATGTIAVSASGVATLTLPADFDHFTINGQTTDIAIGVDDGKFGIGNASPKIIFVSAAKTPYQIINFSDRRQYLNKSGYAYIDLVNNLVTFTQAPTGSDLSYDFDYIYAPDDITLSTFPVVPAQFQDVFHYGMAVDDMIFQLFDRSHSYAKENQANYDLWMGRLCFWNAQFTMN